MAILSKEALTEKAKRLFGQYPEDKAFHFTADGQAFREESFAVNHGRTLEVKDVVKITRQMAAEGNIEVPNDPKPAKVEGGAKNDFQKLGTKSEKGLGVSGNTGNEGDEAEKAALALKYEELSGKKPAQNIKLETLKGKVQELEDAKAAEAAKAAEELSKSGSDEK